MKTSADPTASSFAPLERRKYLALLLTLLTLLVLYPLLDGVAATRLPFDLLLSIVFLSALQAVFVGKAARGLALLLGLPTLLAIWTGYAFPGAPPELAALGFNLIAVAFLGFAVVMILRVILPEKTVTADSIYGAFCAYLMMGLAFGHLYFVAETLAPGSFGGPEEAKKLLADPERRRVALTYVSYTTLTCMGYNEVAPRSNAARGLTIVEAILGQFFIAVLIAELIGKRVAQALAVPNPGPDSRQT